MMSEVEWFLFIELLRESFIIVTAEFFLSEILKTMYI